ncbi:zinc finger protein 185 isoform X2 [Syngnathoides biaculeatus]|uniref:zinc finger protein 185 isoform X2 n=1 Tax=Syngnathoides biaculeatus TaxID=300417 RepID=UPI002ADD7AED|nr:zinc finger protein 185 isoform X2 [Syngnathoides biaculeatus]
MATEGEKATVFRTTKVRTKLKDDGSWMNRSTESEVQPAEEKPWMAELRARRENGPPTSPVSSPTSTSPIKSDSEKGVFTKPVSSSFTNTSNGISGTSKLTKRHSEGDKKIAPHTVKPSAENEDNNLSIEEQMKRTAAASKVLNKSAVRERSYVLSAAKKFESQAAETSVAKESTPFVPKRVEKADDGSVQALLASPASPITSVASVPEPPRTRDRVDSSVKTSVVTVNEPPKMEVGPPEPAKEDPSAVLAWDQDSTEDPKPDRSNVAAPLPELIADYLHVVSAHSDHDDSKAADTHLVPVNEEPEPLESSSSRVETLTAMFENLIPSDSNSTSFKDDEPGLAKEVESSVDAGSEDGKEQDPTPVLSNHEARTEDFDLLNVTSGVVQYTQSNESRDEPELPEPPSPVQWREDLHTEFESNSETVTITTQTVTITEKSEERNHVTSRVATTVTEFSSADPFDPYPLGTTSPNSSSDLLQPLSDISINSSSHSFVERKEPEVIVSSHVLESLADDVIPIDTAATSLSTHRSWARTWESTTPLQTTTEESQETPGVGQQDGQQTLVTFERKSKEIDSPWDRWMSPSVYTIPAATPEEEEEEESLEESQMHTVTTITTVRQTYGEHEGSTMDRTVLMEVPRTPTPEPDTKKPFVYLKEYVDTSEMSSHTATDGINSWSSSYSSSLSSPCTYCGQLVGNDAKITIEHLNISCHPHCFKCASCWKPMGDLIYNMFLHGGKVHCESCYSAAFD